MCIEFIYRHIRKLEPTQIFTTRDMLIYGSRTAVDSALHRMVKAEFIVRLARGVFVRDASKEPSLFEIAEAKLRAFKAKILDHADKILHDLSISPNPPAAVFAKSGHSSSFWTMRGRVYLQGVCEKKVQLAGTEVGKVVYALAHWGRRRCLNADVWLASRDFGRVERELFWLAGSLMPAWLNRLCARRYPLPRLAIPSGQRISKLRASAKVG